MMIFLNRISDSLGKITEKILSFVLFLMLFLLIIQVVFRYIVQSPLSWTEELLRYLMTWLVFLGASMASKLDSHLGINFIQDKLSEKYKNVFDILLKIIICVFLVVLIYYGFSLTSSVAGTSSPVLRISMALPYYSVVVGGLLMLLHTIVRIIVSSNKIIRPTNK